MREAPDRRGSLFKSVKRSRWVQLPLPSKKFEKPLDKRSQVWYNVNVSEREKSPLNKSLAVAKRHENLATKKNERGRYHDRKEDDQA
jgi:hypothetical protein